MKSLYVGLVAGLAALVWPLPLTAQGPAWTATYDSGLADLGAVAAGGPEDYNDGARPTRHIAVDAIGSVYVAGTIDGSVGGGCFLTRYDTGGQPSWVRFETCRATAVALDGEGGVYLTGTVLGYGSVFYLDSWFIVKYDTLGNRLWERRWVSLSSDPEPTLTAATANAAGIVVVGRAWDTATSMTVAVARRYDSSGNLLWHATHGKAGSASVTMDAAGRVTVAGPRGPSSERFLMRYAPDGTESWSRTLATAGLMLRPPALTADESGSAWLAETSLSGDVLVVKWQPDGQEAWRVSFSGPKLDNEPLAIAERDGIVAVSGRSGADGFTSRLDRDGGVSWTRTISAPLYNIALGSSGRVYVCGAGRGGLLVLSYDSGGTLAWQQTYAPESADALTGLAVGQDGSIYASGTTGIHSGYQNADVTTLRYDPMGVLVWATKEPLIPRKDRFLGPVVDSDGGVTVASSTPSLGASELRRYGVDGTLAWTRSVRELKAIATDGYGGVLGIGPTGTAANPDARIERYDREGRLLWRAVYDYPAPTPASDVPYTVAADPSGNVFALIGSTYGVSLPGPVFIKTLVKYDASGRVMWTRDPETSARAFASGLVADTAGAVYVWGEEFVPLGPLPTYTIAHFWVAKYEGDGSLAWMRSWTPSTRSVSDCWILDFTLDGQDNPVLVGVAYNPAVSFPGVPDFWVVSKLDGAGNVRWEKSLDPGGEDEATGVAVDRMGNLYVTGLVGQGGLWNVLTVSYDANGAERWSQSYPAGVIDWAGRPSVVVSLEGTVTVAAREWNLADYDLVVLRYDVLGSRTGDWSLSGVAGGNDAPTAMAIDATGAVTVAGINSLGATWEDAVLLHFAGELVPRRYFTLSPCRLFDSRETSLGGPEPLTPGNPRAVKVTGRCGIPETARALALNLTVTESTGAGNLRAFVPGFPVPLASMANYLPGQTRANNAIAGLGADGRLSVLASQASGTLHLVLDVAGYFE